MEADVEVQRGTEALDEGDRPGPGATGDGESGPLEEVRGDGSIDHAQDPGPVPAAGRRTGTAGDRGR